MKRYLSLVLLTVGISATAVASTAIAPTPQPASFFAIGCGLILLIMARLAWKTRGIGK
jgi:hypothetical protein